MACDRGAGAGGVLCAGAQARGVAATGLDVCAGTERDHQRGVAGSSLLSVRVAVFELAVGHALHFRVVPEPGGRVAGGVAGAGRLSRMLGHRQHERGHA